jgi:hypothetical protein
MQATTWLPEGWQHPTRVALPTGHHLRPIRATDVDLDLRAVLGSQERLWAMYGGVWGWPPADLTVELHREDLARYEAETRQGVSFRYGLFDAGETEMLGHLTIERSEHDDADDAEGGTAEVSWWVVDWLVGGPIDAALNAFVPEWVAAEWPLDRPTFNQPVRRRTP